VTTTRSEDVLYSSLTDVTLLEAVCRMGLEPQAIPTQAMRPVVQWAVDYFFRSSQTQAPSREALFETWGQVFEDHEIEVAAEDIEMDLIQWAVESLEARYIAYQFQVQQREAAVIMAESTVPERAVALEKVTQDLVRLTLSVRDRTMEREGMDGIRSSLADYMHRSATAMASRGMTFGIDTIDEYTYGIHPGELAVLAAGPKTGKSVAIALFLINEWLRGRIACYFTLENSVEMTFDRILCMVASVDHDRFRRGLCAPEELERINGFLDRRGIDLANKIHVISPQRGQRNVQWMTRHARTLGTQSLFVDQLTFVEPSHKSLRGPDAIKDIMHELKEETAAGRDPFSTLLAHQINREGMKAAKASGFLEMHMLAEGSEVERTADWVFGLYASQDERLAQMIKFQTLASRRASELKTWRTAWRPWANHVETLMELEVRV